MAIAAKKASVSSPCRKITQTTLPVCVPCRPDHEPGRERFSVPRLAQAGGLQSQLAGGGARPGDLLREHLRNGRRPDYVYQGTWFAVLLAFLAINISARP